MGSYGGNTTIRCPFDLHVWNSVLWDRWQPAFGGLDGFRQGLQNTAEWFSDPANLARYRPDSYAV